jgi:hypothetical protein
MSLEGRWLGYLYLSLYIILLTKTVVSVLLFYSGLLHKMMKSLTQNKKVKDKNFQGSRIFY